MRKIAILSIFILALLAVNISFAAQQPEMSVFVADIEEGSTAHVSISLPSDATGKVTVSVNGQTYTAAVEGGEAYVELPGLKAGDYKVKVTYEGNGNYSKISKQADLKVSGEAKSNDTAVTTNTSANASGEPDSQLNTTLLDNLTNNTNSNNTTKDTNTSNVTPKKTTNVTPKKTTNDTAPAKKPKQPKKPLASLTNKNTGLPILVLMLVSVGAVFATVFRKQ